MSSIALLLVSALVCSSGHVSTSPAVVEGFSSASMRITHDPIKIMNNSDFLAQKEANNWTGTGAPHDPITISDYRIEFSYEGITIRNVDLHFAIINCETGDYETEYWGSTGIKIINCENGVIEDSLAHMKNIGILIEDSTHITLHYNTVHDCYTGVKVLWSKFILLDNNNFGWNDWRGVEMNRTDMCTVTDNSIIGIPDYGIVCTHDNSTQISGNEITSDYLGEEEEFHGYGFYSINSWNLALWNNVIHDCKTGIRMDYANGVWIWEGNVTRCTKYGIYLNEGTFNITVLNNWIGPSGVSNAYDSGSSNHWDEPLLEQGNSWSDYNGTGYYYIPGPAGSIDHFPNGFTPGDFNFTIPNDTTSSTGTSTHNTTRGDDIQPLLLVISVGSSVVILIVVILVFRSGRSH
ncbi:MAG: right-handed parallel beta-helix repeat-containing protein [Candidatus Thorarchaeota archaeon]